MEILGHVQTIGFSNKFFLYDVEHIEAFFQKRINQANKRLL